jgi:hypothetical protein
LRYSFYYIPFIIVFIIAPVDPVTCSEAEPNVIATENINSEVDPISVVVVSVYLILLPLHIDIICPALALLPDIKVYSKNAPSYEAVCNE